MQTKEKLSTEHNKCAETLFTNEQPKPNDITLEAKKEAESSDNLETLDLSNFRDFVDSL